MSGTDRMRRTGTVVAVLVLVAVLGGCGKIATNDSVE
jgi:hypothetical protein